MWDNGGGSLTFCPANIADSSLLDTYNDNWDEVRPDLMCPSVNGLNLSLHFDPCLAT